MFGPSRWFQSFFFFALCSCPETHPAKHAVSYLSYPKWCTIYLRRLMLNSRSTTCLPVCPHVTRRCSMTSLALSIGAVAAAPPASQRAPLPRSCFLLPAVLPLLMSIVITSCFLLSASCCRASCCPTATHVARRCSVMSFALRLALSSSHVEVWIDRVNSYLAETTAFGERICTITVRRARRIYTRVVCDTKLYSIGTCTAFPRGTTSCMDAARHARSWRPD